MKCIYVDLAARTYPIYIGTGAINLLDSLEVIQNASTLVVITNHTVHHLYGEALISSIQTIKNIAGIPKPYLSVVLPDGETYKTPAQLDTIYSAMLQGRCDRKAVIIALGGGVIGDIAGFAAATYMRGIAFVQIPTTVLAQVDSSVGGKTAVNHPLGKNMIGAFYQPQAVLADSLVLKTLPAREIAAGLAEIIKYGCMADATFFDWLESHSADLNRLDNATIAQAVQRSCEIKANIVAQDETESSALNIRALLNFGHTFGHAFEALLGYGTWLHGEAVGYGMVCAAELSYELGLLSLAAVQRIIDLVAATHLPTQWPQAALADAVIAAMQIDKKNEHGVLKFIVLDAIGASHVRGVDEATLRIVIDRLQHQPRPQSFATSTTIYYA